MFKNPLEFEPRIPTLSDLSIIRRFTRFLLALLGCRGHIERIVPFSALHSDFVSTIIDKEASLSPMETISPSYRYIDFFWDSPNQRTFRFIYYFSLLGLKWISLQS